MSDWSIDFQPAIDEPSNMKPSSRKSSSTRSDIDGDVLQLAARVGEADVDIFDFFVLDQVEKSAVFIAHVGFLWIGAV